MVIVSTALHGIFLGLPWPFGREADPPELIISEAEESVVMDIVILPRGSLTSPIEADPQADSLNQEAGQGKDDSTPDSDPLFREPEPEPELEPESEPEPEPEPEIEIPKQPAPDNAESDPVGELPEENGGTTTTPTPKPDPPDGTIKASDLEDTFDGNGITKRGELGTKLYGLDDAWKPNGQNFPDPVPDLNLLVDRCPNEPPAIGFLIVVLTPDDGIQNGPEMIGSTGYPDLDTKAKEMVETGTYSEFPERTEAKAYFLEVHMLNSDDESCLVEPQGA